MSRHRGVPTLSALLGLVAIAVLVTLPTAGLAESARSPVGGSQPAAGTVAPTSPVVLWNGVSISNASSTSSAFSVSNNQVIDISYSWSRSQYPGIDDARLQMIYFGFPVSTRDVSPISGPASSPGLAVMNWTVGSLQYVLEGVFGITASLLDNGSTVWSENFYARLVAPYGILAALPIILIVLGIVELYALARSGRHAAPATPTTPAAATPATTTAETPATPPPTPPASGDTSGGPEGPPPPGGAS